MKQKFTFLLIFVLTSLALSAQNNEDKTRDNLSAVLLNFQFGLQVPGGDLSHTFGNNRFVTGGIEYQFANSPFGLNFSMDYLFGDEVKNDVLDGLRTSQGYVIGTDGLPADLFLRQRGFQGHLSLTWHNDFLQGPNTFGLLVSVGGGYLNHWIRIQDDRQTADQVRGEYLKGYDHRRAGPSLHQFIGIRYLSYNKRINFTAGFDLSQAWTKSIRPYNFDTREADTSTQLDLLNGFKIGWIIPIYFNESTEDIYY